MEYVGDRSSKSNSRSRNLSNSNSKNDSIHSENRKELPKIQSAKPKINSVNINDITYEIREKITISTAKPPIISNSTVVNQILENPRLYFSGRTNRTSNYPTPKSTQNQSLNPPQSSHSNNSRPGSKQGSALHHHLPSSYLKNEANTSSINDSLIRNNRHYAPKNYSSNMHNDSIDSSNSQKQNKYYSLDYKRGVVTKN